MTYTCHSHPDTDRRTTIPVQDGWTEDGRRIMREHTTQWLPIQCGHDASNLDTDCSGCCWRMA